MTTAAPKELIGTWVTDPQDRASLQAYGRVTLEFRENKQLIYRIHEQDKDQIMFLTYRVHDGVLVTDQPSEPREERTLYNVTLDGKLVLGYEGDESYYIRAPSLAVCDRSCYEGNDAE